MKRRATWEGRIHNKVFLFCDFVKTKDA